MGEFYYTQRQKRMQQAPNPQVGADFWAAFRTYIDRLSVNNYFCKEFPGECVDGLPMYRDDQAIAARLQEELGHIEWPISPNMSPKSERILDLIEFFYKYAAQPTKQWFHNWCRNFHPEEYDIHKGHQEYTAQINALLKRFNHPYKLRKGRIVHIGSEVMDEWIASVEFRTNDDHLLRLLNSALGNFFDRSVTKKLEGLRSIVDAFERLKTLEDVDKKKSVKQVIGKLSPYDDIRSHFDDHLRKMTGLANTLTIRHHEGDKVVLEDEALIDYLFYSYYSLVRLILEKYDFVASQSEEALGGTKMEEGD